MKVTVENKKGLKKNVQVLVEKKIIAEKISVKLTELKNTINLKGFRPGKVPLEILKKQFGKAVYGEVLDKIVKETSTKALNEKKIKIAVQPKIDIKSHGEDKDLEYSMEIESLPEVNIDGMNKVSINKYEVNISKNDVEKKLGEIAKNQNNFVEKKGDELSKHGDLVVFDYIATIDEKKFEGSEGKNTQLVLGKDLFIKGFDKYLIGVKKNQEKEIFVNLPENYPKKELANKKAKFKCKILNVKKSKKTEVNDTFAKNLGAKDLINLKEMIKKQIQDQYRNILDSITKQEILNQIEKFKEITIPESMIEQEIAILTQGKKNENIERDRNKNLQIAKKRIKIGLILNEFGEKNNLKISDEELKLAIQKQINSMPGQEKQIMEYYQKNPSAALSLRGNLYEEKIIEHIKLGVKSNIKKVTIPEAEKIILNETKSTTGTSEHNQKEKELLKKTSKQTKTKKKIRKK